MRDEYSKSDDRDELKVAERAKEILDIVNVLEREYIKLSIPLVEQLIRPFFGDKRVINFQGKEVSLKELVRQSSSDISFLDRWVYSMANSNSQLLRVIDQVVRSNKDKARRRTIEDSKILTNAHLELEKAGYDNTDFMYEFERDPETSSG